MRRTCTAIVMLALGACGGAPVLSHVPRPSTPVVAGAAAAIAGAATLADPGSAGKRPEDVGPGAQKRPVQVHETIPGDVLDRLDAADAREASEQAAPPSPSPSPSSAPSPAPAK